MFETHRAKLLGIAYRMLGTLAEAEDAVQDTYLRWQQRSNHDTIDNLEAFLVTTTTRLCIDHLKSARVVRERYIGPWLPEPIIEAEGLAPDAQHELAQTLSYAFMMLLEQLNPVERAVYILREAFDFKHREIADILGRTPADSRQLSKRAKDHLRQQEKRYETSDTDHEALFARFIEVAAGSDPQPLFDLLADDIALYSDGGGKVQAALRVLRGRERVSQFVSRVIAQQPPDSEIHICRANGQPALRQTLEGRTIGIITMHFVQGRVQQCFIVRNPDKLSDNVPSAPVEMQ